NDANGLYSDTASTSVDRRSSPVLDGRCGNQGSDGNAVAGRQLPFRARGGRTAFGDAGGSARMAPGYTARRSGIRGDVAAVRTSESDDDGSGCDLFTVNGAVVPAAARSAAVAGAHPHGRRGVHVGGTRRHRPFLFGERAGGGVGAGPAPRQRVG